MTKRRLYEDDVIERDLVAQLIERRRELGMSQVDVGKKLRVSGVAVSNWELGKSYPYTLSEWRRWAKALDFLPLTGRGIVFLK